MLLRHVRPLSCVATTIIVSLLTLVALPARDAAAQANGKLQIHFPAVGQGDAAIVISPQGQVVVIDTGPSGGCTALRSYMEGLGVSTIAYHVASHYHDDHIGCTPTILSSFPLTGAALDRGGSYTTGAYNAYVAAVGGRRQTATPGMRVTLDGATSTPVYLDVAGVNTAGADENGDSLVVVLRFGAFDAVFAGDIGFENTAPTAPPTTPPTTPPGGTWPICAAPYSPKISSCGSKAPTLGCNDGFFSCTASTGGACSGHGGVRCTVCPGPHCGAWVEASAMAGAIVTPGAILLDAATVNVEAAVAGAIGQVEVYKVNHHGSASSSSDGWMAALRPWVGVIGVGAGNSYGHPSAAALGRMHAVGAHTYWTSAGNGAAPAPGSDTVGGNIRIDIAGGGAGFLVTSGAGVDGYGEPVDIPAPGETVPTGSLTFSPDSARPGDWVTARVVVTPGTYPASTGIAVSADLRAFGFGGSQPLGDSGASGDTVAGDATFALRFQIDDQTVAGNRSIAATVTDAEGRSSLASASFTVLAASDTDGDGLPDSWEARLGLDTQSGVGANGAQGDPDADGLTNAQELAAGTHPQGLEQRYFAEGATGSMFDTRMALSNPNAAPAHVLLRFLTATGTVRMTSLVIGPRTRATIDVRDCVGMATAEFSTTIESDVPVVADRTIAWDRAAHYGAHAETAVAAPSPIWYLAEGATHSGFDLFYLLQNPGTTETTVRVRYLRPSGAPLEKTYTLLPTSRTNIWVNVEEFAGIGQALASTDVSAVIESLDNTPIIVERAMYLSNQGRAFNAGHESAGVTAPQEQWFMAEGATGDYFDLFVLIANPNDQAADVRVTYLLTDGRTFSRTLTAPPNSRSNIWVDQEQFDGVPGMPLANVAVSTTIESLNHVAVIVERALWWPGAFGTWHEAHNSAGASATGTAWALAEGEVNGLHGEETYILVANTSAFAGQARVTLFFEDGTSAQRTYDLPANSRNNVAVGPDFGAAVNGKRFGAVVESLGATPAQIVVERAMYWNAMGQSWAAGTNALATRLP